MANTRRRRTQLGGGTSQAEVPSSTPRRDPKLETIDELCSYDRRLAGTDAERRAANAMAARLRDVGRRTEIQPIYVHPQAPLIWAFHCILAFAGSVLAISVPIAGFALVLVAATEKKGRPLINARAESIATQPAFAESFRERRCLIPADGFYEWRRNESGKVPIWMHLPGDELFAFAGVWASYEPRGGEPVVSCAIVTTQPNETVRPIHDRMPVILAPEAEAGWLAADASEDELKRLLVPLRDELETREVSDLVNSVREDGPALIEPRAEATLF